MVLSKGNIIHRFNADPVFFQLSPFSLLRMIAIKILIHSYPSWRHTVLFPDRPMKCCCPWAHTCKRLPASNIRSRYPDWTRSQRQQILFVVVLSLFVVVLHFFVVILCPSTLFCLTIFSLNTDKFAHFFIQWLLECEHTTDFKLLSKSVQSGFGKCSFFFAG